MNSTTIMSTLTRRTRSALACATAVVLVSGCSDRPPTGVFGETGDLLQDVRVETKALNMSPGDQWKLTPTVFDAANREISGPIALRYTSSSNTRVTVGDDGTIRALALTEEPVSIIVAATSGQVTQFDTVLVNVIDPPASAPVKLAMYFDGDSLGIGAGGSNFLNGTLVTAAGDTLQDVLVVFNTKDERVAKPSRYQRWTWIQGVAPGKTWVYGTATLGSQTFSDSLYIRVGWSAEGNIGWNYTGRWGSGTLQLVIQPNGLVWWYNWSADMASAITFDDPTKAESDGEGGASGNIPAFSGTRHARRFSSPGTYKWRTKDVKGNEQVGEIIVKPNPE
jgi:hypothetical protein